jgi:hypothetical protein
VPDHSSLSKIRDRYGLATFQRFFERIVELCIEAGLVWGEELYFDSTKVQANASIDRLMPRVEWEAKQRIILHVLVTPASIMDNSPLLDLVRWVCARWELKPKRATGDTNYGTIPNIVGLEQMAIRAERSGLGLTSLRSLSRDPSW